VGIREQCGHSAVQEDYSEAVVDNRIRGIAELVDDTQRAIPGLHCAPPLPTPTRAGTRISQAAARPSPIPDGKVKKSGMTLCLIALHCRQGAIV
jgi:hypothetical protein